MFWCSGYQSEQYLSARGALKELYNIVIKGMKKYPYSTTEDH